MNPSSLTKNGRLGKLAGIVAVIVLLLFCRAVEPARLGHWLPVRTSCGAVTGLPCLLCGMTRALHLLLRGEFSRACYFNWLVFPFALALGSWLLLQLAELLSGRRLFQPLKLLPRTAPAIVGAVAAIFLLWTVQIYLAVSQHKTELLNSDGILYRLLVG